MAKRYLYKNIRTLLTTGFTDDELRILCYDEPEFRAVYENWPKGTNRTTFVQDLIDRAERRVKLDRLLELAREHNPDQYKEHQPYYEGEPIEPVPDSVPESKPESRSAVQQQSIKTAKKAVELFFSYAHKDEGLRDKLATHLTLLQRQGVITAWHDRRIIAGSKWADQIDEHLNSANIILLLISADFLASNYCYDVELKRAMERHEAGEAVVIPIILRPVDWTGAPFGQLQALPKDARPVTSWSNREKAWVNIAQSIREVAEKLTNP
jgi:hypothetical protein